MAAIDLILLGMLKQEPLSAYDMQKLVEYRNISKWVKISTPSVYKKALQLEERGFIKGETVKEGRMPEKAVYSLTEAGEREFERLMLEISAQPVRIFLDMNAVIVNLDGLPAEDRRECLNRIGENVLALLACQEEELGRKAQNPSVPQTGLAVLRQQLALTRAIEVWLEELWEQYS